MYKKCLFLFIVVLTNAYSTLWATLETAPVPHALYAEIYGLTSNGLAFHQRIYKGDSYSMRHGLVKGVLKKILSFGLDSRRQPQILFFNDNDVLVRIEMVTYDDLTNQNKAIACVQNRLTLLPAVHSVDVHNFEAPGGHRLEMYDKKGARILSAPYNNAWRLRENEHIPQKTIDMYGKYISNPEMLPVMRIRYAYFTNLMGKTTRAL